MDEKIEQKVRHLLKEVVDPNTGKRFGGFQVKLRKLKMSTIS